MSILTNTLPIGNPGLHPTPTTPSLHFRACSVDDVLALQNCAATCFEESYKGIDQDDDIVAYVESAYQVDVLTAELENLCSHYYLIIDTNLIQTGSINYVIGYLKLSWGDQQTDPSFREKPNQLQIQRLYIRKSHQNLRLGSYLLKYALNYARINTHPTFSNIWLTVYAQNSRAIAFYERNGFKITGEYVFMMKSGPTYDSIMQLSINIEISE